MLLALAKKLLTNARTGTPELPTGTLTVIELYPFPRYGEIEGIGLVRIEGEGNMVGFSPVTKCVAHGETAWIPTELVKNISLDPFSFSPATRAKAAGRAPKNETK